MRYEEDLSSQEKKCIQTVARYRSSHIGYKFVEAYLVPSARENNSEANKNKIVRYVNNRGYRVAEVKERGFAKLELKFKDYKETNKCLDDDETRKIVFELPGRARTCRGIIVGWDLEAMLDELVDAMVDPSNIVSLERLRKRFF